MKKSIFSIFTFMLAVATLQTANAQTKTTQTEAKQLYDAVMASKADIDEQARKGGVIIEAKGTTTQDGVIVHDATGGSQDGVILTDLVQTLEQMQNFNSRVEKTGGKMTAAQLAAFKAELAVFESKINAMEVKSTGNTQNLTGPALQQCMNRCKELHPSWWQVPSRLVCYAMCILK